MLKFFAALISGFVLLASMTTSYAFSAIDQKKQNEKRVHDNPFGVSLYKPNYFLPISYNTKTNQSVYPRHLDKAEMQFQFSFKLPLWRKILGSKNSLFIAYSEKSFWQAYNESAFFRETNYEPEIFIERSVNYKFSSWTFNLLRLGFVHQSNGRGYEYERSWNRVYLEGVLSHHHFILSVKPWARIEGSQHDYNPDIVDYLGNGRILMSYKLGQQVFSVKLRNLVESSFKHGAVTASWSYPLPFMNRLRLYFQYFNGYGQNLIDYKLHTQVFGFGFALNDWL